MLAKRELLYVPLIGWTWYFLEIVFCKRKWEEDRDTVIEGLRRLANYPEYMWVSVPLLDHEGAVIVDAAQSSRVPGPKLDAVKSRSG